MDKDAVGRPFVSMPAEQRLRYLIESHARYPNLAAIRRNVFTFRIVPGAPIALSSSAPVKSDLLIDVSQRQ